MRRSILALFLIVSMNVLLIVSMNVLPAHAHAPSPGPNGGLKVDAGANHHIELVVAGTEQVSVYLFDAADQPVPAAGYSGNAILLIDGSPQRFALTPSEGNRLIGTSPAPVPQDVKGAVQIAAPDGTTAQAKF